MGVVVSYCIGDEVLLRWGAGVDKADRLARGKVLVGTGIRRLGLMKGSRAGFGWFALWRFRGVGGDSGEGDGM